MLTLGLDPSMSSYGWVVYDGYASGTARQVDRGRWVTEKDSGLEVARLIEQRERLRACIRKYGIQQAGMETPPLGVEGGWNKELLYALFTYNMEVLYIERVDVVLFAPTQLQLLAKVWGERVHKGSWHKSDMQEMFRIDLLGIYPYPKNSKTFSDSDTRRQSARGKGLRDRPFPVVIQADYDKETRKLLRINNDEADAYHAARFGHRFWEFQHGKISEDDLTPSEWDVFAKHHTFERGKNAGVTEYHGIIYKHGKRFYRFATSDEFVPSQG